MLNPPYYQHILSAPIPFTTGLQHECVSQSSPHPMQDRCTSSEWIAARMTSSDINEDRQLLSQCINISLIFAISAILFMHLYHLNSATRGSLCLLSMSQNLNLSICSSSLQPREWVRISCHHFIFYFYCSWALPLITNDGYNDLWCAKSLFMCGWEWVDGSAEGREWYRWV